MTWKALKRWLPLVGLLPVIWLGLYIMFWLDRADCAEPVAACLGNAFGHWVGDAVMLQWVPTYQTLLGAVAAIMAGGLIFLTSRQERNDVMEDRTRALKEARIASLLQLQLAFVQLNHRLIGPTIEIDQVRADVGQVAAYAAAVAPFSPWIARWATMTSGYIESQFVVLVSKESSPEKWASLADLRHTARLAARFFYDVERLFDANGGFTFVRARRSAADGDRNPEDFTMLRGMYEEARGQAAPTDR